MSLQKSTEVEEEGASEHRTQPEVENALKIHCVCMGEENV